MPAKQFRVDLDLLWPTFRDLLFTLVANCNARGAVFFVTCGTRTWPQQDAEYAKGRNGDKGPVVTHAKAGESVHNFGLGVDMTHDSDSDVGDGLQPDWQASNYEILKEEAEKLGLVSGACFSSADWPHVQVSGYVSAKDLAPLRAIYLQAGGDIASRLAVVWHHLESLEPKAVSV